MIEQGIVYFGDPRLLERNATKVRPLNVMFLTSVRDTGACDLNGIMVETGQDMGYMEGVIERTVREAHPLRGVLGGIVRVVGVITDDMERDIRGSSYGVLPGEGKDWIHPLDLKNPDGQPVTEITRNIPSTFRSRPLHAKAERRQLKYEFETTVLQWMRELQGDVLISDHYMARLDHLHREPSLFGRILNIHPAVTLKDHPLCLRGKTPTADAIERARLHGMTRTGATLHFINQTIDDGPPIAFTASTPVYGDDNPQWLRYRNYRGAKVPLFIAGLAHYARSIYPYLDQMDDADLDKFQPMLVKNTLNGNRRTQVHESVLLG